LHVYFTSGTFIVPSDGLLISADGYLQICGRYSLSKWNLIVQKT